MFRARCAALILAAGLGLACGCLCRSPFCSRNNGEEFPTGGCCEAGGAMAGEAPCLQGGAPAFPTLPPGYVPSGPPAANGMPRLAPVPQGSAPVVPYAPQSGIKDSRPGDLELVR
jgi:hypothetical protein